MASDSAHAHPTPDAASRQELAILRDTVQRLEQAERLQRALYAISDLASAGLNLEQTLARLHGIVGELMSAENFFVARYDLNTDTITFAYFADVRTEPPVLGTPIPFAALEHGLTWYVIRTCQPLRGSINAIARLVPGPLRARGVDAADWLGVPMMDGDRACGVLVVQSYDRTGVYDEASQALLSFVASHVLTALTRWQAHEALEQAVQARTAELSLQVLARERGEKLQEALYRIAELSSSPVDSDTFHAEVHRVVGGLLNVRNYFVVLISDDLQMLQVPYHVDERDPTVRLRPLGKGLTEHVLRTEKPLLADPDALDALELDGGVEIWGQRPLSWLGVPLRCEGYTLGVLAVQSYTPAVRYTEADRDLLVFVSHQIASSLQRRRAMDELHQANADLEARVATRTQELREQIAVRERMELQLKHEAVHDGLTGLPNRRYLHEHLERLFASFRRNPSKPFAVMFMDVDRFKQINDTIGHHAGDLVLCEMARRIKSVLREPDMVARLGGDEFAVAIDDAHQLDDVAHIARRLLEALEPPMAVAGRELFVSSSIGVAVSRADLPSAEALLRHADAAMYRAKTHGRKRFEFYDEDQQQGVARALDVEAELRAAVTRQEFEPHYLPVYDIMESRFVGCEVLLRWRHPTRGMLEPAAFLKAATDNGLIEAIDWHVYEIACTAAAQGKVYDGLLGLHVAPRHLRNPGFAPQLLALLARCALSPTRICLEVSETALSENTDQAIAILQELRSHGVRVALDNFGTGSSQLASLPRLPLTALKIDRSLVAGLVGKPTSTACQTVVRAVIAMAKAMGLTVVAEGVEDPAQRVILQDMGCEQAQGYLLGRPQPNGAGRLE